MLIKSLGRRQKDNESCYYLHEAVSLSSLKKSRLSREYGHDVLEYSNSNDEDGIIIIVNIALYY